MPDEAPTIPADKVNGNFLKRTWIYFVNQYHVQCAKPYPESLLPWPGPPYAPGSFQAILTAQWHALSDDEKNAWQTLAKRKRLPTYQTYMGYNMHRVRVGLPTVAAPT